MKQAIKTLTAPIHTSVVIPGSKSITNRALLLAALAQGTSHLSGILLSDDTRACLNALCNLGITVNLNENNLECTVVGGAGKFPQQSADIWCQDAGTVARFLLAACAALPGVYRFDATPRLRERPIATLLKTLTAQGAGVEPANASHMPFTIHGAHGLNGGNVEIDASESGQFVSAVLMAAPFAKKPIFLKTYDLVSKPYVKMTCLMMQAFGVNVTQSNDSEFSVPVPQQYQARDYVIEPDLSTASYFFAAAALTGGEITIPNIHRQQSTQGDIAFLTVLEKMGCTVTEKPNAIQVKGPQVLHGVSIDMGDFSDTFMTLATLAPFANSPTLITNIGHTRHQESDRIAAVEMELRKLAIQVETGPDWIKIFPGTPQATTIASHNDHRIAMAFSLIGLRIPGIIIDGAECAAKTCPNFFAMWDSLSA